METNELTTFLVAVKDTVKVVKKEIKDVHPKKAKSLFVKRCEEYIGHKIDRKQFLKIYWNEKK